MVEIRRLLESSEVRFYNMAGVVKAIGKVLPSTPRKMSLVAHSVRGLSVSDALIRLNFSNKRAALYLKKVICSAIANAQHNFNYDVDRLFLHEIVVGKSITLRRISPRAMGRAYRIKKVYSMVTVKLVEKV